MNIFIDKENAKNLYKNNDSQRADKFIELIRKMHIVWNFDEKDIDGDDRLESFFTLLKEGNVTQSYNKEKYPPRPLNIDTVKNLKGFSDVTSAYIFDVQSEEITELKDCILCGGIGEEYSTVEQLLCRENSDNSFMYDLNKFSWKLLGKEALPCTDIIMCDNFLFSDEKLTDINAIPMLTELTKRTKNKVNIVVFTSYRSDNKTKKIDLDNIKNAIKKIKSAITGNGGKKPNVTFITRNEKKLQHDRTLITNYKFIKSGYGFNLFKIDGNINERCDEFEIKNCIPKDQANHIKNLIEKLNKIYKELKILNNDGKFVIGDKVSNFIDFNVEVPTGFPDLNSFSNDKREKKFTNADCSTSTKDVSKEAPKGKIAEGPKVIGKIDLNLIKDSKRKKENPINGKVYEGKIVLKNNYKNIECDEFSYFLRIQDNSKEDVEEGEFITFTANLGKPYWFATNVRLKED